MSQYDPVGAVEFARLVERMRCVLGADGTEVPALWGPPRSGRGLRCLSRRGGEWGVVVEYRGRSAEEVCSDLIAGIALVTGMPEQSIVARWAKAEHDGASVLVA